MSTINMITSTATPLPQTQRTIWFILSAVFAAVALFSIGVIMFGNTIPEQEITSAVANTSLQIDHALARGAQLDNIINNQGAYTDTTFNNLTITINAGSCGTTTGNAYTITATDDHGNIAVFNTTANQTVTGTTKTADLTQLCGNQGN